MTEPASRSRRLGRWGFEGESFPPSPRLTDWLLREVGPPGRPWPDSPQDLRLAPARELPVMPVAVSSDPRDRLAHARGQGLPDMLRLRIGSLPAAPDAVVRPGSAGEVEAVVAICAATQVRVVPWGGGTSVTGGVNAVDDPRPSLVLQLERLSGLTALDEVSRLATFGPGTPGPRVEAELATHGLTLGHYPQSWELATVGGWVATRSSGQESLGYGRIEDMVAGLELVAPSGRLELPALPASAAGPDLRQLVLGSEGRLGVITGATLRVRPRPEGVDVTAVLLPDLESGLAAVREVVRSDVGLTMVRLSDGAETEVAMAVGLAGSALGPWVERYLRLRGRGPGSCLLLAGAAGDHDRRRAVLDEALEIVRPYRPVSLGLSPGRHWLRDRFRHPYLRDGLLDLGWATDTLETAVPWARAAETRVRVAGAMASALAHEAERVAVLCHVSHPYVDGASLYFTFFFRLADDLEANLARWARIKRAAGKALVASGATITHHHGVGQWHAPWLDSEIGLLGHDLLGAAARAMDPAEVLNPHVLLDPTDRLED